jgi:hypothetical protein
MIVYITHEICTKTLLRNESKPKKKIGAGNETRTRDPDLGKVVLYQLSYSRIEMLIASAVNLQLLKFLERETRLELATPTLARSCSTN